MDYIALFNLLYSTEISEATKDEIINKINAGISESYEVKPIIGTYMELLDTLVFSTASESLIYNIIDEAFSQLSEEVINEVSNEWVKKKVGDSLKARQSAVDSANKSVKSGVVGLSQLRRQDQAQQNLDRGKEKAASIMNKVERRKEAAKAENTNPYTPKAEAPKKEGALGKLKSAVGKVKSWASNVDKTPDYVGLSRAIGAKANKDNIGAETLRQQTTHKAEVEPEAKVETPKVKPEQAPSVKAKKVNVAKANEVVKAEKPKVEAEQPAVKAEVKADDATKAAKKKAAAATAADVQPKAKKAKVEKPKAEPEVVQQKLNVEAPKEEPKATKTTRAKKIKEVKEKVKAKVEKPTAETPKEVKAEPEQPKATRAKKVEEVKEKAKKAATKEAVKNSKKTVAKAIGTSVAETPKEVKAEPEETKATEKEQPTAEASKKRTGKIKINVGSKKANKPQETQTPEIEAKTDKSQETSKVENKPAEEKTAAQKEYDKFVRKMNAEKERRRKDQERMLQTYKDRYAEKTATPGYDQTEMNDLKAKIEKLEKELGQAKVTEALSDLAVLLLDTNISENCFVEVMEMVAANKANAQKALARDEQSAMAVIDDINKDLQAGKPVDPEKVKDAEEKRKKQEHFEELFKKKFGDND